DGSLAWGAGGDVVCNASGAVLHQNARFINDGKGNVIAVFEDARSGYTNIYAQKIGGAGSLLWGKDGLAVAKVKADQTNPQIIPDGAGGALVAWEDSRSNANMIYAQRITAGGQHAWTQGSLPLTKTLSRQGKPVMVPDGKGGAIIAWEDERDPLSLKDIYGQRVSGKGELLWDKNGLKICGENGDQAEPDMISDGKGGAILTWTDYRQGDRNPDIYAQRVAISGKLLWDGNGVVVCGAPDIQCSPRIARAKTGGIYIVWTDRGGGSYDIYAQRLNADGKTQWLTDGIPVCQAARTQQNPIPLVLGEKLMVVWEDYRNGNWDIFANSLSAQGKLLWSADGVPVASLPFTQYSPQVIGWKDGGLIFTWEDYRNGKQYEI
ncbi:MAG TPA: hypothetical protein VMT55_06470, partial [Candidatus Sulfotelmatobacter sp.]|nr:hypothetical protein [Candidatus Sulfotelmatobacter sp.]